ncbi:MAG: hypothetical protein K9M45_07790 [Kiritimatiellales bacterium]|nr:hypothetical protein [Kiritimatiellales bacterium]
MKATIEMHPKFKKLKRRLDLPLWQVKGLLEAVWNLTAQTAYRGDIGKLSNDDIAASIEWDGDADELIMALLETGWLDKSENHRLVVHDWEDHCAKYVKANIARYGGLEVSPKEAPKGGSQRRSPKGGSQTTLPPNLTQPNQTVEEADKDFFDLLENLKKELTPQAAIEAIRASHPAFKSVPEIHLAVSLQGQPDRQRWAEAVEGLAAKYAGADLPRPNAALRNWLAGKPGDASGDPLRGYE